MYQQPEDDDKFSFNVIKHTDIDFEASGIENSNSMDSHMMSGHSASKHYSFTRKTSKPSLDIDSDIDDDVISNIDTNQFITKQSESSSKNSLNFEEALPNNSNIKVPSAGPSGRKVTPKVRSPRHQQKQDTTSSLSDSDESDEMGIAKKKKSVIPGEYNSSHYAHLEVNNEVKEIFQYIQKYTPQQLNLDFKFKPFIPEFIPAVGDIDAFLKVIPPEKTLAGESFNSSTSQLGLTVLDEPAANQSDPALLYLQLRASSITGSDSTQAMVVKKIDNIERNSKIIDKWIKDVAELHRNKPAPFVKYTNPMPDIDDLMQQWPEQFENSLKLHGVPNSKFCGNLSQYVDIMSSVFDIPIYKNKVQSLHTMFCLYAAVRNSELYQHQNTNTAESKDNAEVNSNQTDRLVLE